jgi:predicted HicB family RNase H-like nuclease
MGEKKVTSIKIEESLHEKAKIEAVKRKITLAELIEESLKKELK